MVTSDNQTIKFFLIMIPKFSLLKRILIQIGFKMRDKSFNNHSLLKLPVLKTMSIGAIFLQLSTFAHVDFKLIVFILSLFALILAVLSFLAISKGRGPLGFLSKHARSRDKGFPSLENLLGDSWKIKWRKDWSVPELVGESVSKEDLLNWGFKKGSTVLYEGDEKRIAFTVLTFSSSKGAEKGFDGISSDIEEQNLYPVFFPVPAVGKSLGTYSESLACDQVLLQNKNFLALVTVGGENGAEKGDSLSYAHSFEEKIN